MPIGVLGGVFAAASLGVLSRSVYVDLIAWWPVWLGLIGLAVLLQMKPLGSLRPGGIVALLGSVAAVLFLLGHLSGWALMPSASARLVGPEASEVEVASLTAVINGRLDASGGSAFLYEVYPVRWGGSYGLPGAVESVPNPQTVEVTLVAPADPGRMGFAGWEILLAVGPTWTLDIGGVVSADLSALDVIELVLGGSGDVELGGSEFPRQVTVSGVFELRFPAGVPILVKGEATVPEDWIETEEGWRSPHEGEVWRVIVEPGSVATIATP